MEEQETTGATETEGVITITPTVTKAEAEAALTKAFGAMQAKGADFGKGILAFAFELKKYGETFGHRFKLTATKSKILNVDGWGQEVSIYLQTEFGLSESAVKQYKSLTSSPKAFRDLEFIAEQGCLPTSLTAIEELRRKLSDTLNRAIVMKAVEDKVLTPQSTVKEIADLASNRQHGGGPKNKEADQKELVNLPEGLTAEEKAKCQELAKDGVPVGKVLEFAQKAIASRPAVTESEPTGRTPPPSAPVSDRPTTANRPAPVDRTQGIPSGAMPVVEQPEAKTESAPVESSQSASSSPTSASSSSTTTPLNLTPSRVFTVKKSVPVIKWAYQNPELFRVGEVSEPDVNGRRYVMCVIEPNPPKNILAILTGGANTEPYLVSVG
jgi:hypothetical protein